MKHMRSVKFVEVALDELTFHPAAEAVPMDAEDAKAIADSVASTGVMEPVKVIAVAGGYQVVDGVNRCKAAAAAGLKQVACHVVEGDVAQIVSESLIARRKCTSAQRLFAFLEVHKTDVLRAHAVNAGKGEIYRNLSKRPRGRLDDGMPVSDWSALAIADRLNVHHTDVEKAIELLVCREEKKVPEDAYGSEKKDVDPARYLALVDEYRLAALSGQPVSVRRWKAAVASRYSTRGADAPRAGGKANINYYDLFKRSVASLTTVFGSWEACDAGAKASPHGWDYATAKWEVLAAAIPEALLPALYARIFDQRPAELKRLVKIIQKHIEAVEEGR